MYVNGIESYYQTVLLKKTGW